MGFYEIVSNLNYEEIKDMINKKTEDDVIKALDKKSLNSDDLAALLSPASEVFLEQMAVRGQNESLKHFGKSIGLYTPMYLANYCVNKCLYCGFNYENDIKRSKLTANEIREEAKVIAASGLRHILVLTGECTKESSVEYIAEACSILREYFDSISIEIYPLEKEEYSRVIEAGVDGLTIYQEVYNMETYKKVHVAGPKSNYKYRMDACERACEAGIRNLNIGALLGLDDWRVETYLTGFHLEYLIGKYPDVEYGISIPRIRPHAGEFKDIIDVTDRDLTHSILAYRNFLPFTSLNLSTREERALRDNLIPLGVTRMSAGVSTAVGGHSNDEESENQFEISDERNVQEIKDVILSKGINRLWKIGSDIKYKTTTMEELNYEFKT